MNKPRLLIVRGLPGSGKSTYIRNNYPGLFTLETDCFNCVGGQYYWTSDRSKEAIRLIEDIRDSIFNSPNKSDFCISGVFGRFSTMNNHIIAASYADYDIYIKTLTTQYQTIHNVPEATMKMFRDNFLSEKKLIEIFNGLYTNKDLKRFHFGDMPKIDWAFHDEPDNNFEKNNE